MGRGLTTQLGKAYEKCTEEGAAYARCVETRLGGAGFGQGVCKDEFEYFRRCVKKQYHPLHQKENVKNPFAK